MSADDVLGEIDAALEDYDTDWRPGLDAATWHADGSHQPRDIDGTYFGMDRRGPRTIPTTPAQHRLAQGCGAEPLEEIA